MATAPQVVDDPPYHPLKLQYHPVGPNFVRTSQDC